MVSSEGPAGQFCSQCGARCGESDSFCAGCGSKRVGDTTGGDGDSPFLQSRHVSEIVRVLEGSDSDGTFSIGLTNFLFFEGSWLDEDFGKLSVSLTNPDHINVDERLDMLGWEIFEPGEGLDSSYEQVFDCPDTDSRAGVIRKCLQALALTSSSQKNLVSVTFSHQVNGKWIEVAYPLKKTTRE
jgi:hypothetical protein